MIYVQAIAIVGSKLKKLALVNVIFIKEIANTLIRVIGGLRSGARCRK